MVIQIRRIKKLDEQMPRKQVDQGVSRALHPKTGSVLSRAREVTNQGRPLLNLFDLGSALQSWWSRPLMVGELIVVSDPEAGIQVGITERAITEGMKEASRPDRGS